MNKWLNGVGRALVAHNGRIYAGENTDYKLNLVGISHHSKTWQVLKKGEKGWEKLPDIETKGELGVFHSTPKRTRAGAENRDGGEPNTPNSLISYAPDTTNETPPGELPSCPDCGLINWTTSIDGDEMILICECGYRMPAP